MTAADESCHLKRKHKIWAVETRTIQKNNEHDTHNLNNLLQDQSKWENLVTNETEVAGQSRKGQENVLLQLVLFTEMKL